MNGPATKAIKEFFEAMEQDDCSINETASVLHAMGYGLVRENMGPEAALDWAHMMATHAAEIGRRDAHLMGEAANASRH